MMARPAADFDHRFDASMEDGYRALSRAARMRSLPPDRTAPLSL